MSMQANPWDNDPIVGQVAPSAGPVYGAAKPVDPYRAQDQAMQVQANERANAAAVRSAAAAERAAAAAERPTLKAGYMWGPDGKTAVPIPGIPNEAQDPKLAEGEKKAAFLATNLTGSARLLAQALKTDQSAEAPTWGQKIMGVFGQDVKNTMLPDQRQVVEDSQLTILDSALTLGTGAAYTPIQLEAYRQTYFPQIGDSEASIAAKRTRLKTVMMAARIAAGNAAPQIDEAMQALGLNDGPPPATGAGEFGGEAKAEGFRMSPEQSQQFTGFLTANKANLTPEAMSVAYQAITGQALDPQKSQEVIAYLAKGGDPSKIGVDYSKTDSAAAEALAKSRGEGGATDLLMQGATLGLSDEAAGVGNMAANLISAPFSDTDLDLGGAYTTGRDAERLRLDGARKSMGGLGTAIEVGGSLASGNVSNALAIAPTLGGRVLQGARAGAAGGAVGGFGYGSGVNSLASAAGGAALGAGLGAAIPVAANVVSNRVGGLARITGRDPALPRRIVNEAIEADGSTPAAVGQMMDDAAARGSPMMMADTGENARALLASVGRQPGPSRTLTREAVQGRQDAQAERISAAVVRDLGPTANIREMGEELIERARTAAAPLYDAALSSPGASSVKLDDLAMRPSFRKALYKAADIAAEEGTDPTALGFQFNEAGDVLLERVPSFKTLDYIKRGLDDVVETYRDKTTGKLVLDGQGRATNASLRTLIARMDKVNPAYAEARAAYAGPAKMKEAMDKGFKALNRSPDDIMAMMKEMGDSQKEAFRLGIRKSIVDLLGSKRDGGDKVAHLIGTPKSRAVLTRVFGGRGEFDRFVATLRDEEAMGRTYKAVAGNSATAERLAQDAQSNDTGLAETAMDVALRGSKDGPWSALVGAFQKLREVDRFGAGQAGERTRESIAALLSETDPATLRELVAAARQAARQQGIKTRRQSRSAARLGRDVGVNTGAALGRQTEPRR